MEKGGKLDKANDHINEILYLEMVHQQMETFVEIDMLIKNGQLDSKNSKTQTTENTN